MAECVRKVGIGFLFAPMLHGAMKYAIGPRRELGIRTIFNILGPLTNPARPNVQLTGVFAKELIVPIAEVLLRLGMRRSLQYTCSQNATILPHAATDDTCRFQS